MSIENSLGNLELRLDSLNDTLNQGMESIAENLDCIAYKMNPVADSTNWTTAEGVSGIWYELQTLNETMAKLVAILESKA